MILRIKKIPVYMLPCLLMACTSFGVKNSNQVKDKINGYEKGTYGYDRAFLKENNIATVELTDKSSKARVLLAPGYQGRVMTSSANLEQGTSFGWINYKLIRSGKINEQFNPVGGEERFWLGPEGGPFSIYFKPGVEQDFKNWKVPAVIDTEGFEVKEQDSGSVTFVKNTVLKNASGTDFKIGIERTVTLLSMDTLSSLLNVNFHPDIFNVVAFQSRNTINNLGDNSWTREGGLLSVWILSMFSPSQKTTVFIPIRKDGKGAKVNDDYFGKLSANRLIVEEDVVYFRIDGKYRCKIGIPQEWAKELCGSYDFERNLLTLVWGSLPVESKDYVNSRWGDQDDPYNGDAINAYNDGPLEDKSIMGPFYEIETSSPGATLQPGESLSHIQRVVHVEGNRRDLANLVTELFDLDLNEILLKFQ